MEFPRLNLYQLMIFFYVASEGSITSAAEKLYLTQPTVSGHIKSLENFAGVKLIEIKRRRVSLTPDGEVLYRYCKEIHSQAIAAERFFQLQKNSAIIIGVSPIFVTLVSRTISSLAKSQGSRFKLNLLFGGASIDLVRSVVQSKIDIAVVPDADYGFEKLDCVRISSGERLVFYASPNHPVFGKDSLKWKDLCKYPIIMGQDAYLIQKALTQKLACEGVKARLKLDLTTNNVECCKILAQDGKGISVALMEDIDLEIEAGRLKALSLPDDLSIPVVAVLKQDISASPVIQDFITCLKNFFDNSVRLTRNA